MWRDIAAMIIGASLLWLGSSSANAGMTFCNQTGMTASLAIGYSEADAWRSRGWFTLKPLECNNLIEPLTIRYVYYYAEAGSMKWSGGNNNAWFCADHEKKFSYLLVRDPPCDGYYFKRIDAGGYADYTFNLLESSTGPRTAALNCRGEIANGRDAFIKCWTRQIATAKQTEILNCIDNNVTAASIAICGAKGYMNDDARKIVDCSTAYAEQHSTVTFARCVTNGQLGQRESQIMDCAIQNQGSYAAMASCAAGTQMTQEQRRLYECVARNYNDYQTAGLCAVGTRLSPEQARIANCVMQNRGSYVQMGVCAAGSNLTPEQQVFLQCAATTGGQPYAFAGCVGTQLTLNELQKCMNQGIGGSGCFGDNNTAVKFVSNAWKDVTQGPGTHNEIFGGQGTLGRTLEDIRKSAPPPLTLGTVGGHRVCVPWC